MTAEVAIDTIPSHSAGLPVSVGGPHATIPASPPRRPMHYYACKLVGEITNEMSVLIGGHVHARRDRRRRMAHVRQIAMYVCHVCLQLQPLEISSAFGRDPATVRYACHIVEDRRDDRAYDDFVAAIERTVLSVFAAWEDAEHA